MSIVTSSSSTSLQANVNAHHHQKNLPNPKHTNTNLVQLYEYVCACVLFQLGHHHQISWIIKVYDVLLRFTCKKKKLSIMCDWLHTLAKIKINLNLKYFQHWKNTPSGSLEWRTYNNRTELIDFWVSRKNLQNFGRK